MCILLSKNKKISNTVFKTVELQGLICTVFLPEEDRTVSISCEHLEPVVPMHGDAVKVIMGEDREAIGQLISIDTTEGVVRLGSGSNEEVKLLALKLLCRYVKADH